MIKNNVQEHLFTFFSSVNTNVIQQIKNILKFLMKTIKNTVMVDRTHW